MRDHRRRNRAMLLGTFLLFFLPVVVAWLLNVYVPGWLPFGTTNHGTLVQPVRPVTGAGLRTPDGRALDAGYLTGRWTLVHVPGGPCAAACLAALARHRQVQLALGDDMGRVQLLLVLRPDAPIPSRDVPEGVTLAIADPAWLEPFGEPAAAPGAADLYLVDPQRYLMMRYAGDVAQRDLLSDIERLLKISKIG